MKKLKSIIISLLVFVMAMSVSTSFVGCKRTDKDDPSEKLGDEQVVDDPTIEDLSSSEAKALLSTAFGNTVVRIIDPEILQDNEVYFLSSNAERFGVDAYMRLKSIPSMGNSNELSASMTTYIDKSNNNIQSEDIVFVTMTEDGQDFSARQRNAMFQTKGNKTAKIDFVENIISFDTIITDHNKLIEETTIFYGDRILYGIARLIEDNIDTGGVSLSGTKIDGTATIAIDFKKIIDSIADFDSSHELSVIYNIILANFSSSVASKIDDHVKDAAINTVVEVTISNDKIVSLELLQYYSSSDYGTIEISLGGAVVSKQLTFKDNNYGDFQISSVSIGDQEEEYLMTKYTEESTPSLSDGLYFLYTSDQNAHPVYVQDGSPLLPTHAYYSEDTLGLVSYLTDISDHNNILGISHDNLYLVKAHNERFRIIGGDVGDTYEEISSPTIYAFLQKASKPQKISNTGFYLYNEGDGGVFMYPVNLEDIGQTTPIPKTIHVFVEDGEKIVELSTTTGEKNRYIAEEYNHALVLFDTTEGGSEVHGYIIKEYDRYKYVSLENAMKAELQKLDSLSELLADLNAAEEVEMTLALISQIVDYSIYDGMHLFIISSLVDALGSEEAVFDLLYLEDDLGYSEGLIPIALQGHFASLALGVAYWELTAIETLLTELEVDETERVRQIGAGVEWLNNNTNTRQTHLEMYYELDTEDPLYGSEDTEPATEYDIMAYLLQSPRVVVYSESFQNMFIKKEQTDFESLSPEDQQNYIRNIEKEISVEMSFLIYFSDSERLEGLLSKTDITNIENWEDNPALVTLSEIVDNHNQLIVVQIISSDLARLDINQMYTMFTNSQADYLKIDIMTNAKAELGHGVYKALNQTTIVDGFFITKDFDGTEVIGTLEEISREMYFDSANPNILTLKLNDTETMSFEIIGKKGDNIYLLLEQEGVQQVIIYTYTTAITNSVSPSGALRTRIDDAGDGLFEFTILDLMQEYAEQTDKLYIQRDGDYYHSYFTTHTPSYGADDILIFSIDSGTAWLEIKFFATETVNGKSTYYGYTTPSSLFAGHIIKVQKINNPSGTGMETLLAAIDTSTIYTLKNQDVFTDGIRERIGLDNSGDEPRVYMTDLFDKLTYIGNGYYKVWKEVSEGIYEYVGIIKPTISDGKLVSIDIHATMDVYGSFSLIHFELVSNT